MLSFTAKVRTLLAAASLCTGCVTLQATLQSAEGELTLLAARKPIDEVIQSQRTPPRVRALLSRIAGIKRFGEENGLTATANYQDYVKLHRPAAVWVVTACAPLRFAPKTWSFPIAGDFPYLGWFDLRSAQDYARDLESDGWDVEVRGAAAFSTLGWFHDPVLSTMIPSGPEALGDLVDVVLHESVHATLHLEGQATFNESLASFVAGRLTGRYLDEAAGVAPFQRRAWRERNERSQRITEQLHIAYQDLANLYLSSKSDEEKRAGKAALLAALRERLRWKGRLNNASLIGYQTYSSGAKGFALLLAACKADFRCFFDRLRKLRPGSFARPHEEDLDPVLTRLAESGP
jgi:predicted aminopeptidase